MSAPLTGSCTISPRIRSSCGQIFAKQRAHLEGHKDDVDELCRRRQGAVQRIGRASLLAGLKGIHLNFAMFQPSSAEIANADAAERKMLADAQRYNEEFAGYYTLQNTRPQSVAFGLADSPVGLAAWIYALFQDVSDSGGEPERVFSLDAMIDDIMLYWLPNAGPSSARLYWESARAMKRNAMAFPPMPTPTGISMFPGEQVRLSRRWAAARFANLVHFNTPERGGHFAALEQPALFVAELRATFAKLD